MNGKTGDLQTRCIEAARRNNKLLRAFQTSWSDRIDDHCAQTFEAEDRQELCRFWGRQMAAALAPENFLWANPAAVKRLFDTEGESLSTGHANWLRDAQEANRMAALADRGSFQVGETLAVTPGAVVYRNRLMELIQYAPTTRSVHETPLVFIQPWINKYYILDLTPANSMLAWLRDQGFLVFTVSWKNPDSSMRDVGFEDYVFDGALEAVERVRDITGRRAVHAVGFCIGGTALASLLAWLSNPVANPSRGAFGRSPVAHWTLLASLVDFSDPGELGLLVNADTLRMAEALMEQEGFLDAAVSEFAFRLLRSDRLIWQPAARSYLFGYAPPKSDVLYWNSDATRLPERMLSFYLRAFYIDNRLASPAGLEMKGRRLDLGDISQPLYLVGCIQDHISPWTQSLRIRDLVKSPMRFALSSEGHIAGIVNPPSQKSRRRFWAAPVEPPTDPLAWLAARDPQQGSWWPDWARWLAARCGPQVPAPDLGSEAYPPLCPAPGRYVLE
ncbi:MAG: PHA/PHB synthase family protein [Methyloligellaceae bacterium]